MGDEHNDAAPPTAPAHQPFEDRVGELIAQLFGFAILAVTIGAFVPAARGWFFAHWALYSSIAGAIVLVLAAYGPVRRTIRRNARTRVGAVIVSLALLSILVASIGALPPTYQIAALRSVLVFTVCLIPGILYYLFITTRRDSLLNEFLSNLQRLGLLLPQRSESDSAFKLRVLTYLQRFEAVYGQIEAPLAESLVNDRAPNVEAVFVNAVKDGKTARSLASIFTPEAAAPLVICTVLMALGWIISLPPWHNVLQGTPLRDQPVDWTKALYPDRSAVYFAFLGAYFFGIQMLFRRYMLKDLRANAYVAISIRIVLAVVGTWVLVEIARVLLPESVALDDSRILVTAFVIGVFPPVVWQFIQAFFKKVTFVGVFLPSVEAKLPLSELDGLTIWHEARLQEEDIENVPNMATASIVELMLNTRFSPNRIIDWVDQAILFMHLGSEQDDGKTVEKFRSTLRAHGIRTASALVATYKWAGATSPLDGLLSVEGHSTVRTLVQSVQTNRNLHLINTWRGLTGIDWDNQSPAPYPPIAGVVR
jgi:hypothetical protein